ncbi:competence protein CoiA [Lacticaseibacillus sp. 53-4]|uniref:competence protein CoiA n=1 Tax=Lacticaseibacillus sp. 53-4 TaxID=2799575 RepID=UPI00194144F8|nr:competence protein CoiA family protein [Lacticaseibacillus sp. 53-4]
MLVALNQADELVTLRSHDQARRLFGQSFRCPACKGELRIKNGAQLIAHFAHKDNACSASSEPESETHLAGKWWLAKFGEQLGDAVALETYYPPIQQRADVVWQHHGRPRILEFQCSGISPERLQVRTVGYQSLGLEVIWIAGPAYITRWPGAKQARFLQCSKALGFHLWQLDPQAKVLTRLQLTGPAIVETQYRQGLPPQTRRREYIESLASRAKALQLALVHRAPAVMKLQAQASAQGRNLAGAPWLIHMQLRHLPGLDAPEWAMRAAWLLTFQAQPIKKAAEAAFWRQYSSVRAPQLPEGQLQSAIRRQWLEVLTQAGLLQETAAGWQWLRVPQWYQTIDEKLQALGQARQG